MRTTVGVVVALLCVLVWAGVGCTPKAEAPKAEEPTHPPAGYHEAADGATAYGLLQIQGKEIPLTAYCPTDRTKLPTVMIGNEEFLVKSDLAAVQIMTDLEDSVGVVRPTSFDPGKLNLDPADPQYSGTVLRLAALQSMRQSSGDPATRSPKPAVKVDPADAVHNKAVLDDVVRCWAFYGVFQ